MYNKLLIFFLSLFVLNGYGQTETLNVKGYIKDQSTGEPLEYVNIICNETKTGSVTDSFGFFIISDLYSGHFHFTISHIGCETQLVFADIETDTTLYFTLDHTDHIIDDIVITGSNIPLSTEKFETLTSQDISDSGYKNISNILESISGVSTLKNGSGISKPVVHGLYGNRITILNNGVAQAGQQWGNDHSPEIDPLVANQINVIKGTSSLEYMGSNLGSVILVQPQNIGTEPHLNGKASYFFESNGLTHATNIQIGKKTKKIGWRLNGTIKKGGDKKTPSYFLNNTGTEEANLALTLEKKHSEKLKTNFYASTFNTQLGVLRGSHISNLTDLEQAFQKEKPFFTEDNFSYAIDAPKQKINHHLLKLKSSYFLTDTNWLNFTFASQLNIRKEFDIRRGGRTDTPALSLKQYALFLEGKYHTHSNNGWKINSGIQVNIIDNTNDPETGILPLIPDYISYESGAFVTFQNSINMSLIEFGFRYSNFIQNVVTISKDVNQQIIRFQNIYNNLSGSAGWRYKANENLSYALNVGFGQRSPGINELYSGGLHQGVSGIEEGNLDLKTESSLKSTFTILAGISNHISFESLLYFQNIGNYIFLEPQDEIRLTIRGAFPVFKYEQTQAQIFGLDINANIDFSESIKSTFGYSYIKGKDVTNKVALINIPSNVLTSKIDYESIHAIKIGNSKFENLGFEINGRYVFKQNDITSDQDFVTPPEAYFLLGLEMSTEIQISSTRLRWILKAENILNVEYRDYLNRQRYFADDIGFNLITGFNLKF